MFQMKLTLLTKVSPFLNSLISSGNLLVPVHEARRQSGLEDGLEKAGIRLSPDTGARDSQPYQNGWAVRERAGTLIGLGARLPTRERTSRTYLVHGSSALRNNI